MQHMVPTRSLSWSGLCSSGGLKHGFLWAGRCHPLRQGKFDFPDEYGGRSIECM